MAPPPQPSGQSIYDLKSTAIMVVALGLLSVAGAALNAHFGDLGVLLGAAASGFTDAHAVMAGLAAIGQQTALDTSVLVWAVLISISTNTISKTAVCLGAGSRHYAQHVVPGLVLMVLAVWVGAWVSQ